MNSCLYGNSFIAAQINKQCVSYIRMKEMDDTGVSLVVYTSYTYKWMETYLKSLLNQKTWNR